MGLKVLQASYRTRMADLFGKDFVTNFVGYCNYRGTIRHVLHEEDDGSESLIVDLIRIDDGAASTNRYSEDTVRGWVTKTAASSRAKEAGEPIGPLDSPPEYRGQFFENTALAGNCFRSGTLLRSTQKKAGASLLDYSTSWFPLINVNSLTLNCFST